MGETCSRGRRSYGNGILRGTGNRRLSYGRGTWSKLIVSSWRLCFCGGTRCCSGHSYVQPGRLAESDPRAGIGRTDRVGRQAHSQAKEEGVLEVDAKISLERERILEQEALIRLKWPSGAYVVSEYGDGRVKTTSWVEVPDKLRRSLVDIGPETWICHPFSGFSVYFFLKAHELGKWQGNLLMEMEKERVYTRLDDQGNPRTGYKSGFGDIPDLLYTNQSLIDAQFRDEDFITFRKPTPKDKRAKKPSPTNMSDEDYATAMEDHRFYLHELDVYREFEYIRKDFQFIVSCFSELYGDELFNYLRVNQDNHELRKRFVLALDNGDCVFDCSLREPFNSRLIIEKIKKRWSELEVSARNFASHFARKAFNDLAEYDFVKAKHADRLQDLLDRPCEDILAEEIIDSLPSCTVVEEMEVEEQPTPAPAPASEVLSRKSRRRMCPWRWMRVPRPKSFGSPLMRMSLWKALLWKRYPVGNPALAQCRLKQKALLRERDPLGALNRAHGSQR